MKTLRSRPLSSESSLETGPPRRRARRSRVSDPVTQGGLSQLLLSQSAACTFLGLTLGVFISRKFFILPLAVAVTLTQELAKERLAKGIGH